MYFYNADDWGVEEAYRAFEPNYKTVVTDEFMNDLSDRIWVIDNAYGSAAEDLFGDETEYKIVSQEKFYTKYHSYNWSITLVEKVK